MTKRWLSWIRSSDKAIIDVLVEQAENLVKATSKLWSLLQDMRILLTFLSKISDMEHENDEFVHKLFSVIDQSFVTPLDREDISKLTSSLDEILDYTHGAADRLVLFKIDKPALYILEMSKVLLSASQEVHFTNKNLKRTTDLIEHCHRISRYEHQGSRSYSILIIQSR